MTQLEVNNLTYRIVQCAIQVHRTLGPGLLENVYEVCLCHELSRQQIPFVQQMRTMISYNGIELNTLLRIDILVSDTIVCELKAVADILPVHEAQVLSYMRLLRKPKGLLFNFYSDNLVRNTKHFLLPEYLNFQ